MQSNNSKGRWSTCPFAKAYTSPSPPGLGARMEAWGHSIADFALLCESQAIIFRLKA